MSAANGTPSTVDLNFPPGYCFCTRGLPSLAIVMSPYGLNLPDYPLGLKISQKDFKLGRAAPSEYKLKGKLVFLRQNEAEELSSWEQSFPIVSILLWTY